MSRLKTISFIDYMSNLNVRAYFRRGDLNHSEAKRISICELILWKGINQSTKLGDEQ